MTNDNLEFDKDYYLNIIEQKDKEIENLKNEIKELETKDLDNQRALANDMREVGFHDPIVGYNIYRNNKEKNPEVAKAAKEGVKDRQLGIIYLLIFFGVIFLIGVLST